MAWNGTARSCLIETVVELALNGRTESAGEVGCGPGRVVLVISGVWLLAMFVDIWREGEGRSMTTGGVYSVRRRTPTAGP